MAYQILSLADLALVDGWNQAARENDQKEMYRILYRCGLDITEPFKYENCTHRTLTGKVVTCDRIVGTESTSPWWLASGAASEQVKLEQCEGSLVKELATMGRRGITSAEVGYNSKDYNK